MDRSDCIHLYLCQPCREKPATRCAPRVCVLCHTLFMAEGPRVVALLLDRDRWVCDPCVRTLRCAACRAKLQLLQSMVAECFRCGKVQFFCATCSRSQLHVPERLASPDSTPDDVRGMLEQLCGGRSHEDVEQFLDRMMEELTRSSEYMFSELAETADAFEEEALDELGPEWWEEEEDEDWWKRG